MKLLTIAIPTWNRANQLNELIIELTDQINRYSLQDQIELLISDNDSIDETYNLVSNFAIQYNYIKYSKNHCNLGAKTNVIIALAMSSSKFVLLLGDDDRIRNNVLIDIFQFLKQYPDCSILIDQFKSKFKSEKIGPFSIEYLLRNYYWHIGNAGCFILNTNSIDHIVNSYGIDFFNECWPQTQIMILKSEISPEQKIYIHDLNICVKGKHDEVMIYTSYYLWRTCSLELYNAINTIKNQIPANYYLSVQTYMKKKVRQNFYNLLQCAVFIDDNSTLKQTRRSILQNLKIFTFFEKIHYILIGIILYIPRSLTRPMSNIFIFILKGKRGLLKKNEFVLSELTKQKNIQNNSNGIRKLEFEKSI